MTPSRIPDLEPRIPTNGERALAIPAHELNKDRFGISRDRLNDAIADLPPGDGRKIEALWSYCAQRDLGRDRLGQLLLKPGARYTKGNKKLATPRRDFYSADSIYQLLTGKRMEDGANLTPMLGAIDEFLQKVQPSASLDGFMETRLFREITMYAERALRLHKIGYVVGKMSRGKTWIFKKLAESNPSWLYTQMPTGGVYSDYLRECATKSAMSVRQAVQKVRYKVLDGLPEGVIIDDADLAFDSARQANGVKTFQFIKEAYDRRPRGFLFAMDDWGFNEFLGGINAHRLQRLWLRRIAPFHVPDVPYQEDLNLYAASVGLEPAPDREIKVLLVDREGKPVLDKDDKQVTHTDSPARLQNDICEKSGIGVWLTMLRDAADLASEPGKPRISWGAVLKVHALDAAMEQRAGVGKR